MSNNEQDSENHPPQSPKNNNSNIINKDDDKLNIDDKSKDKEISKLRARIYDLKQRENDYDSLNQRYKQLMDNFAVLKETKNRLEYEINQRQNEYNRHISDLKAENKILQLGLNDNMTSSKKITFQNNYIEREIDLKKNEINDLNDRVINLSRQLDNNTKIKKQLIDMIKEFNHDNMYLNDEICKLKNDNICLLKIIQDNENNIRTEKNKINDLSQKLGEGGGEMLDLNHKIFYHENNINCLQHKIDSCNEEYSNLKNNMKNYENEINIYSNDNTKLKQHLLNEKNLRIEKENQNDKLKKILIEKEAQINQLYHDIGNLKILNKENKDKNNCYKLENEKLRNHIKNLENQNINIINEIDNLLDEKREREVTQIRYKNYLRDKSYDNSYKNYNNFNIMQNSQIYTYQYGGRSYI